MNKKAEQSNLGVRYAALQLCMDILEKGLYANLALERTLRDSSWSGQDKKLLTELTNGTVRMVKRLDWVLNLFLRTGLEQVNPWLRNLLRLSAYQLLFMDKIPDYAVVNSAVDICHKKLNRSLSQVCNGVLRNIIRSRDNLKYPDENTLDYLAVYYSHPEWIVKKMLDSYGKDLTETILRYNNQTPVLTIRTNRLKISREQLEPALSGEAYQCSMTVNTPWALKIDFAPHGIAQSQAFQQGLCYVQGEASMLAAAILDPQPYTHIIDLCCGVGGKTTHLAEYTADLAEIDAFDLYPAKIKLLQANCQRLGITSVQAQAQDILQLPPGEYNADYVLLDVPCSGWGVLNKRADLRWSLTPDDLAALIKLQVSMLNKAAQMVKTRGCLLYATCTLNPEENQQVVRDFLSRTLGFSLQGFAERIQAMPLDEADKKAAGEGMLTILPGKYYTEGMFYALLRSDG